MVKYLFTFILTLWMGFSVPPVLIHLDPLALSPLSYRGEQGKPAAVQPALKTNTPEIIMPVQTVTPQPDGQLIHIVQAGQTLIMIANAYGVTLNDLYELNNLSADNPLIYAGQKLIVHVGPTPTISPTPTETSLAPTLTPLPTNTPVPLRATRTPTVTAPPTPQPPLVTSLLNKLNRRAYGTGIIILCALGLAFVVLSAFRKK